MKKKSYIILLGTFVLVLIGLILIVALKDNNSNNDDNLKSEEYLKYEKIFKFELSSDQSYYIITKLKTDHQNDHTVSIPNTIDNIPVKKLIGDNSNFDSWRNVKIIEIPENIEYIGTKIDAEEGSLGDSAFIRYQSQTVAINVSPQNKVYSSIEGVLYNKDQTILIRYPNSKVSESAYLNFIVPESVVIIYDKAFYKNERLASITLSSNLESIGKLAFYDCNNLSQIIFNNNLKKIGSEAFSKCSFKNIVLPNSLVSLCNGAFEYNELLQELFVPNSVKEFGFNIVSGCSNSLKILTTEDNYEFLKENEKSFGFKEICIKE